MSSRQQVILLVSDGTNQPALGTSERAALLSKAATFKNAGGIILCIGIRAYGDGYALLQQVASGGFFVNLLGNEDPAVAIAAMESLLCNFCAQPQPSYGTQPCLNKFRSVATVCARVHNDSAGNNLVPAMTGNTTPSGQADAGSSNGANPPWMAFDHVPSTPGIFDGWQSAFDPTKPHPWLQYKFDTPQTAAGYAVTRYQTNSNPAAGSPLGWILQGSNDGTTWTDLDANSDDFAGPEGEAIRKTFTIGTPAAYIYYRLNIVSSFNSDSFVSTYVDEFELLDNAPADPICRTLGGESNVSQEDADNNAYNAAVAAVMNDLGTTQIDIISSDIEPQPCDQVNCGQPVGVQLQDSGTDATEDGSGGDDNGGGGLPQLPPVTFSPNGGTIGGGLDVTLSVPGHPDASIRYVLAPNTPSFIYPSSPTTGIDYDGPNAPVHLTQPSDPLAPSIIKAVARKPGYDDSVISTSLNFVSGYSNNTDAIQIPDRGAGGPEPAITYPSVLYNSTHGTISDITVSLVGFGHQSPGDVQMLLVSPSGTKVCLMRNAGGGPPNAVSGLNINFKTSGAAMPQNGTLASGDYAATQYGPELSFPSPGPVAPYQNSLASLVGEDPFGEWALYIIDTVTLDSGQVTGGWSLTIT